MGHFLCGRVQGVERFAAQPRHFSSQVPPPPRVLSLLVGFTTAPDKARTNEALLSLSPAQ